MPLCCELYEYLYSVQHLKIPPHILRRDQVLLSLLSDLS